MDYEANSLTSGSSNKSISVYIHWPYCLAKCPYCDFNSYVSNASNIDHNEWLKAYLLELENNRVYIKDKKLKSVFFGGGTPSLMKPNVVGQIVEKLLDYCRAPTNMPGFPEITLECNPSAVEVESFKAFKGAGINRVSLGIQSFVDEELTFLGRNHNGAQAQQALTAALETFNKVSFDLIYGLPKQSLESWSGVLQEAVKFNTDHLSIYELTIEPGTPFFKQGIQPVADILGREFYELTNQLLESNGFSAYEVSNYAKSGSAKSAHNLNYWRGGYYLGLGPGAHGRLCSPTGVVATYSHKNPQKWLNMVLAGKGGNVEATVLTKEQRIFELLILSTRIFEPLPQVLLDNIKIEAFQTLEEEGYLQVTREGTSLQSEVSSLNYKGQSGPIFERSKILEVQVTSEGRMKLNSLVSYLGQHIKD